MTCSASSPLTRNPLSVLLLLLPWLQRKESGSEKVKFEIGGVRWEAEEDEGKEEEEQEEQELERVQFKVTRGLRSNSRIQVR